MRTERIEYRKFACVAEAQSHYYVQGFATFSEEPLIMRRGNEEVLIEHLGLLDVEASHVRLS